jgi:hypothetical protein
MRIKESALRPRHCQLLKFIFSITSIFLCFSSVLGSEGARTLGEVGAETNWEIPGFDFHSQTRGFAQIDASEKIIRFRKETY